MALLRVVVYARHAQAVVAVYASLVIVILSVYGPSAPFPTVTHGGCQAFRSVHHTCYPVDRPVLRRGALHSSPDALDGYRALLPIP